MRKPSLQILIAGFSLPQHSNLINVLEKVDGSLRLNKQPLAVAAFKAELQHSAINIVLIKHKPTTNLNNLLPLIKRDNPDCIAVELVDAANISLDKFEDEAVLQTCRIINDPSRKEFYLALQFVLQYTKLKIDFRRCKSLLHLSESRAARLVDSSSVAIAYLFRGQILHANISFLVMFNTDSVEEIKRFPLLKLIDEKEREVFASYLTGVKQSPHLNTELALTMKRVTGEPFNAKIMLSTMVVKGRSCYQLWVKQVAIESKPDTIPVTQALNIWDLPLEPPDNFSVNPFDRVLNISEGTRVESSINVMLDELQHGELVRLRFRDLYEPKVGALNNVWVDLDVVPEEFKKINALLAKTLGVSSNPSGYAYFWDQLLFKMVCEELLHERSSQRMYLVELSPGMILNTDIIVWLYKMLKVLGNKSAQLMLLVDAQIPMNRIPQTQKIVELLRGGGSKIALRNFSVDTTPLFLYKRIKPERVILDHQWLDALKEREDGHTFLSRFVQQIEARGVSVIIPQAIQKRQDRLLVLSGTSFGHEKTTQKWA